MKVVIRPWHEDTPTTPINGEWLDGERLKVCMNESQMALAPVLGAARPPHPDDRIEVSDSEQDGEFLVLNSEPDDDVGLILTLAAIDQ